MGKFMQALSGIISDRIRSGEIPADAVKHDRPQLQPQPKPESIRKAAGRGLGNWENRDGTRGGRHRG